MTLQNPTALERSVLRAIREMRPWRREDLETAFRDMPRFLDGGANAASPPSTQPLVLEGEFLAAALMSVSGEMRRSAPWQEDAEEKTRGGDELRERLTKPARDQAYDGYIDDPGGFRLTGFTITGDFDVTGGEILFPVVFAGCRFEGNLELRALRSRDLFFLTNIETGEHCQARSLNASMATIDGNFNLSGLEGLKAAETNGGDNSSDAKPADQRTPVPLDAERLTVNGPLVIRSVKVKGGLDLHGAKIAGDCFLDIGFEATDTITLSSANIGGYLSFDESKILLDKDNKGYSVDMSGIRVGAALFFRKVETPNCINLIQAIIGARAEFLETKIIRREAGYLTIDATEAVFNGGLYLTGGFESFGVLDLTSARIDGDLLLTGAKLNSGAPDYYSLLAPNITISGRLVLVRRSENKGFCSEGGLDFEHARIGGDVDCSGAKISVPIDDDAPSRVALSLTHAKIEGAIFLWNRFEASGEVTLVGATVDGGLLCNAGAFRNPKGRSLNLARATIKSDVFLRGHYHDRKLIAPFVSEGTVDFTRATIEGNMMCEGGSFTGPKPKQSGVKVTTALDLNVATVDAELVLANFKHFDGAIDLRQAKAGVLIDDEANWNKHKCRFRLDGFVYDKIGDHSYDLDDTLQLKPVRAQTNSGKRMEWLKSQPRSDVHGVHFKPQPFTQLANTLIRMGHENDAKRILFERDLRIARNEQSFLRPQSFLQPSPLALLSNLLNWLASFVVQYTAGFGHRPQRAGILAIIIWLFGALVFHMAAKNDLMRPAQEEIMVALAKPDNKMTPLELQPIQVNGFLYSADVFLPIVDLSQQKYWIPKDLEEIESTYADFNSENVTTEWTAWQRALGFPAFEPRLKAALVNGLAKTYYWLSIIAGWLLTTILVAAFSGVLSKDK